MTAREFCYWLQGYFEVADKAGLTASQAAVIEKHLAMVFAHEIDPSYGDQAKLNEIHGAVGKPRC